MQSISLRSPAKLNLFLKVINKRPDGYHNIVTLFERINLFDDIRLSLNRSGRIRILCDHPQVPRNKRNLAYKAAKLLQDDFAFAYGVNIKIKKRIPVAAGLGGGSSNAATVLLGLNRLWKLSLTERQLKQYAQKLGSDVPFFLTKAKWAVGTSRGDHIRPLSLRRKLWHILIVPQLKLYSSQAFGAFKMRLTKRRDNVNILVRTLQDKRKWPRLNSLLVNDLETAIFALCPKLFRLKDQLRQLNTAGTLISGSGPAVFGVARSENHAKTMQKMLKKRYSRVMVVRTL